jgi:hypothetical protein
MISFEVGNELLGSELLDFGRCAFSGIIKTKELNVLEIGSVSVSR